MNLVFEVDEERAILPQIDELLIKKMLSLCEGNRTMAAKKLGVCIRTFRNKIVMYDIDADLYLPPGKRGDAILRKASTKNKPQILVPRRRKTLNAGR